MRNFIYYWFYNQLIFIMGVILATLVGSIIVILPAPFYDYLSENWIPESGFYLSIILFYAFFAACLKPLYSFARFYWRKKITNYQGSLNILYFISCIPLVLGFISLTINFCMSDISSAILQNSPSLTELLKSVFLANILFSTFLHLSSFIHFIARESYWQFTFLVFLTSNIIPLAFFFHLIYKLQGVKPPFKKMVIAILPVFIICSVGIKHALDNSNIVRSHNFASPAPCC